jgi:diguanylate cyclase (GGDEF)-like protein
MTAFVIFLLNSIEQRKKAEAELQESRDKLEQRVKDRTADLAEMNQSLIAEITERRKAQKRLRELSEMDPLTGIYNRRRLHELLKVELSKAKRHERNLSFIMLDLDHFKDINDKFGHDVGDQVLKRVAEIIQGTIRQGDICARFGGEEFVIVTPETPLIGAVSLAEKMRVSFAEEIFMQAGRVTISAGASGFRPGDSEASLIKRADEALYAAKNAGRNIVKAAL